MSDLPRLVVLISGNGSNLQALLDAVGRGELEAEVTAVVSNKGEAYGLERARRAGIPALVMPKLRSLDRRAYDCQLAQTVLGFMPDWVLLAGWMRILSMEFLGQFPGKVVNIHPALPGAFPGTHAIQHAWEAYSRGEIDHTGVMVHLVPDEGVDAGPVLGQQDVPILPEDTLDGLEERIHAVEHRLYVQTMQRLITGAVD